MFGCFVLISANIFFSFLTLSVLSKGRFSNSDATLHIDFKITVTITPTFLTTGAQYYTFTLFAGKRRSQDKISAHSVVDDLDVANQAALCRRCRKVPAFDQSRVHMLVPSFSARSLSFLQY